MASQVQMELSLGRSSRLAVQVLERAQKRSVYWRSQRSSPEVHMTAKNHEGNRRSLHSRKEQSEERAYLNDAFDTIKEFMANTTYQCQKFYSTVDVRSPSEYELCHVCRYHSDRHPEMSQRDIPKNRDQARTPEDFHIQVSPGTYAVTASVGNAGQRTKVVQVNAGDSVNLTFHL